MSFICHATNELVFGEPCVQVPTKIRKVTYIAQTKPDRRSEFLQFASQSEGWEIVATVPVRRRDAEFYATYHPPEVVEEKEVRFLLPTVYTRY